MDIVLPEDPAIPLLGIYPKDAPTCNKDTCSIHHVHSSLIYNSEKLELIQMFFNRGMAKIIMVHTEYYLAITDNDFIKFLGKWMKLEANILSEVTQSQKNTHGVHSLIRGY